jgi:nucleoside-diphosphate-sugar epimerase
VIDGRILDLSVSDLSEVAQRSLDQFDGLIWYAFILKNRLSLLGSKAYRAANDRIADYVFRCVHTNPHLRISFFSSGAAHGLSECPAYEADPYAHLKIVYERELFRFCSLVTIYPYATLGKYVPDHCSFAAASFIYQAITTGRIVIEAKMTVVRSYGSVHDLSRLLLRLYESPCWAVADVPSKIVPVTHSLTLNQLAQEVAFALGRDIDIIASTDPEMPPSVYVASDHSFGAQLLRFDIAPSSLTQQLREMAEGSVFANAPLSGASPKPVI